MDGVVYTDKRGFPEARYVILYVSTFLAFVIIGTFFAKMFYSATNTVAAAVRFRLPETDDISVKLFALAQTELSTAIELSIVFFAAVTYIPTMIRSAVTAYRGAALGWSCAMLNLNSDAYIIVSIVCYTVASIVMIAFAAEGSGKRPETGGLDGKLRYTVGFLIMSALVFAAELVPTVMFS